MSGNIRSEQIKDDSIRSEDIQDSTIQSEDIGDGEVKRDDLNVNESGQAVIRKIIPGNRINISETGADSGTGDVTISADTIERGFSQVTLSSGSSTVVSHPPMPNFRNVQVWQENYVEVLSTGEQVSVAAWEPLNISSTENNIRNNIMTDLAYNNNASGQAAGFIVGLDMGTPTQVSSMKLTDWASDFYMSNDWEFIGSNTGAATGYTTIFTVNDHVYSPDSLGGYVRDFPVQNFRYYGVRCITPNNASFAVWSELEVFLSLFTNPATILFDDSKYELEIISDTETKITNISNDADLIIGIIGE